MKKAFTLIELLVVMVIAVTIMAVALPSFFSMGKGMAMRGATQSVRSTVSLARQWAITHRSGVAVQLSPSNTLLVVDLQPEVATNASLSNPLGFVREIGVGFFYESDPGLWVPTTNLDFTTAGGLKREGDHKITLTETNGGAVIVNTILVNWMTGGIAVQ